MAQPITCDGCQSAPGAFLVTMLSDGTTVAFCDACWPGFCGSFLIEAAAAIDSQPATEPADDPADDDAGDTPDEEPVNLAGRRPRRHGGRGRPAAAEATPPAADPADRPATDRVAGRAPGR